MNNDILKGTSILIGRDSGSSKLLIVVIREGQAPKGAYIGEGKVPLCVSRCKPKEGTAHCKIDIDVNGKMTIGNLKDHNSTFVDGTEIITKRITPNSKVALGYERYNLDISAVLSTAEKVLKTVEKNIPLDISHLKPVWEEYEEALNNIKKEQKKRKKICTVSRILSPLAIVLSIFLTGYGLGYLAKWAYVLTVVSVSITIYVEFLWKDYSDENSRRAYDKLVDNYICPHPNCRHFMGKIEYRILRQNRRCSYCGHALRAD